eukprot:5098857-Pyramimonas_sp.AAC.1
MPTTRPLLRRTCGPALRPRVGPLSLTLCLCLSFLPTLRDLITYHVPYLLTSLAGTRARSSPPLFSFRRVDAD